MRTLEIGAAAVLLLGLTTSMAASQARKPAQPNIPFILTDDLGYGDVGVFWLC